MLDRRCKDEWWYSFRTQGALARSDRYRWRSVTFELLWNMALNVPMRPVNEFFCASERKQPRMYVKSIPDRLDHSMIVQNEGTALHHVPTSEKSVLLIVGLA